MRRLVIRRVRLISPRHNPQRSQCLRTFTYHTQLTTKSRPNLPFLSIPVANRSAARCFTTERRRWLKHEAKLAMRYTVSIWGIVVCFGFIYWLFNEEQMEKIFPTPHEWSYMTRKYLRDANYNKDPQNGQVNWVMTLQIARDCVMRLEDAKLDGKGVSKLSDDFARKAGLDSEIPGEFNPCDISGKSEEWKRGYFEAIMLAAKAAEHTDGWVRDRTRDVVSPPEFVIGPSNPHPTPIPAGQPHAPREEDCEIAYPSAENFYMKIIATKGFSHHQNVEAALEYASFLDYKQRPEADALRGVALAHAVQGIPAKPAPFNPGTYVLNEKAGSPSLNILDTITAIATHKARSGEVSASLPIYLSLLKARRLLPNDPPTPPARKPAPSLWDKIANSVTQTPYPAPPPDGNQPPWRSPEERCQEASLSLYIGEILFASSSRNDGLSWTRDSVDLAEEQLRALGPTSSDKTAKTTCRECLIAGLDNWGKMVAKLAKEEEVRKQKGSEPSMFSFWSGTPAAEDRWSAEEAVVKERVRRTRELVDEVHQSNPGLMALFKA